MLQDSRFFRIFKYIFLASLIYPWGCLMMAAFSEILYLKFKERRNRYNSLYSNWTRQSTRQLQNIFVEGLTKKKTGLWGNVKLISCLALHGKKCNAKWAEIILFLLKKVDVRKGIFFLFYQIVIETPFYERI